MIRVHRARTRDAGGCMACEVSAAHPAEVLVIEAQSNPPNGMVWVTRFCDGCMAELRRQVRERRPR